MLLKVDQRVFIGQTMMQIVELQKGQLLCSDQQLNEE